MLSDWLTALYDGGGTSYDPCEFIRLWCTKKGQKGSWLAASHRVSASGFFSVKEEKVQRSGRGGGEKKAKRKSNEGKPRHPALDPL
jgi:hypothetical protein